MKDKPKHGQRLICIKDTKSLNLTCPIKKGTKVFYSEMSNENLILVGFGHNEYDWADFKLI